MTVAEGGGKRAVENKLRDMYVPTLKANYLVWPAVQLVNFRLMPIQFQLVSRLTQHDPVKYANYACSHLYHQLVLRGRHTSHCQTQQETSKKPGQHLARPEYN
jgi:hypothetical protein